MWAGGSNSLSQGRLRMRISRRLALAATAAFVFAAPAAAQADSFSLGVAAGEVTINQAKLWAHPDQDGLVHLELATDPAFSNIVQRLALTASPANDDTVQAKVFGLSKATRYWYRFTTDTATSDVGTFVTAPGRAQDSDISFAWTGDQDAESLPGQTTPFWNDFSIFQRMQQEGNDFNIDLGDTIYSDSEVPGKGAPALDIPSKWAKYRLNLSQAKLANLRGSAGFYSHWDDHEFINDFSRFENVFSSGTVD